jgi:type IV pilus assembly protein PilX
MSLRHARQRGISLFIVMVMVLLTTLVVMWASRTALFNELVTGNDADYQRALEAAQAMVRDAEFDIKGTKPDGTPCKALYEGSCRQFLISNDQAYFPQTSDDFQDLTYKLTNQTPSCVQGICVSTNVLPEFWLSTSPTQGLEAMKKVAARYGELTGAVAVDSAGNALLKWNANESNAWYWVEVLPFDTSQAYETGTSSGPIPNVKRPYVYRITAIAKGHKPGSLAVVQTNFVWKNTADD